VTAPCAERGWRGEGLYHVYPRAHAIGTADRHQKSGRRLLLYRGQSSAPKHMP
jgi:hypothetical protein